MQTIRNAAGRLWPADALRGAALLNMLAYHAMYDWVYVFGRPSGWYDIFAPGCHIWQQYICWSFLLLSGYSFALAHKPWKNGLMVGGCALLLTAATVLVMPSERILFGVLHLLACAQLLTCAARPLLQRVPAGLGLAASAALFALCNQLPFGRLGFEQWTICNLPRSLYNANIFWLGFQDIGRFYSADYFPLLPWLFLFWCGYFGQRLLTPVLRGAAGLYGAPAAALRPLCAIGRNTLLVYMLHQPVLYGGLWLADRFL